jgi:hypothetical protein
MAVIFIASIRRARLQAGKRADAFIQAARTAQKADAKIKGYTNSR